MVCESVSKTECHLENERTEECGSRTWIEDGDILTKMTGNNDKWWKMAGRSEERMALKIWTFWDEEGRRDETEKA